MTVALAPSFMYVIHVRHYLNDKGDIAVARGPARKMADFVASVIAVDGDGAIIWHCAACGTQGRISNWQGTFWDLSSGMPSD